MLFPIWFHGFFIIHHYVFDLLCFHRQIDDRSWYNTGRRRIYPNPEDYLEILAWQPASNEPRIEKSWIWEKMATHQSWIWIICQTSCKHEFVLFTSLGWDLWFGIWRHSAVLFPGILLISHVCSCVAYISIYWICAIIKDVCFPLVSPNQLLRWKIWLSHISQVRQLGFAFEMS